MIRRYYRNAAEVEAILKGAVFVRKLIDDDYECNGQAVAYSGDKCLYRGPSGNYIVNSREYRGYGPPKQRVLSLPGTVNSTEYLSYESEHPTGYSPWYDMIEDEIVEIEQDEPKRGKGPKGLPERVFRDKDK